MENATKALLIAGAILIAILIIAVIMFIYQQARQTIDTAASRMSQTDKNTYNSVVEQYLGDSVKGSAVKQMIDDVKGSNSGNIGQTGKFISILAWEKDGDGGINGADFSGLTIKKLTQYGKESDLKTACNAANFYDDGNNGAAEVNAAEKQMDILRNKINGQKNYVVKAEKDQGVIIRVYIAEIADQ